MRPAHRATPNPCTLIQREGERKRGRVEEEGGREGGREGRREIEREGARDRKRREGGRERKGEEDREALTERERERNEEQCRGAPVSTCRYQHAAFGSLLVRARSNIPAM
jgi:hypothetical protein